MKRALLILILLLLWPAAAYGRFPLRAAFYYPWYSAGGAETWKVNGFYPHFHPELRFYDSSDQAIIDQHIRWLDLAKVNVGIASWWGPNTHKEYKRIPLLLNETLRLGSPLRWALYYEKEGYADPSVTEISADLSYLLRQYAGSAAFARVGLRPVLFVYGHAESCATADRWRRANAGRFYLVLKLFPGFRDCPSQPDSWHQYAPSVREDHHSGYSFSISPGFWRADEATPRRTRDRTRWQQNIRDMVASGEPWQLVTTFNEWGEGTATEPAIEWTAVGCIICAGHYLQDLHNDGRP